MSQDTTTPKGSRFRTGMPRLDGDLEALYALEQNSEARQKIREQDSSTVSRLKDVVEIIPIEALRIASQLIDKDAFLQLKNRVPEDQIPLIASARDFALAEIKRLLDIAEVKNELAESLEKSYTGFAESLRVINTVGAQSAWFIDKDSVTPAVRFVFSDYRRKRVLLDSTLDWDDACFVALRILEAVAVDMEIGLDFSRRSQKEIQVDAFQEPTKHVFALEVQLERIKRVLKEFQDRIQSMTSNSTH